MKASEFKDLLSVLSKTYSKDVSETEAIILSKLSKLYSKKHGVDVEINFIDNQFIVDNNVIDLDFNRKEINSFKGMIIQSFTSK